MSKKEHSANREPQAFQVLPVPDEGVPTAVYRCDGCGERIEDLTDALLFWNPDPDNLAMAYSHKRKRCTSAIDLPMAANAASVMAATLIGHGVTPAGFTLLYNLLEKRRKKASETVGKEIH